MAATGLQRLVLRAKPCPPQLLRSGSRRSFFKKSDHSTRLTRLTYMLPSRGGQFEVHPQGLLEELKAGVPGNEDDHDAAVILVTPELTKQISDKDFMGRVAQLLSGSSPGSQFHLLAAVVDRISPSRHSFQGLPGVSILRGSKDSIFPDLWEPFAPRAKDDADAVAALTFELGRPTVTLPLARTTFINSKTSTLIASSYDMDGPTPRLAQCIEKHSQHVRLSTNDDAPACLDESIGLSLPLIPLTKPRTVVGSFGNIVKSVHDGDRFLPASTELEEVVNQDPALLSQDMDRPRVWAMVAPPSRPQSTPQESGSAHDLLNSTSLEMANMYRHGGRIYQILSGGGGWGAKKGLLSLDPQQTHFSLSEEEEMEQFQRTMDNGSEFAPAGSTIQFLTAPPSIDGEVPDVPLAMFGVSGTGHLQLDEEVREGHWVDGHFGALANDAIYISDPSMLDAPETAALAHTKLSVPNSRIWIAWPEGKRRSGSIMGDIGFLALISWLSPI